MCSLLPNIFTPLLPAPSHFYPHAPGSLKPLKVDADRISQIKKDICDHVLIGEIQLRSVLNPAIFFIWNMQKSPIILVCELDLRTPLQSLSNGPSISEVHDRRVAPFSEPIPKGHTLITQR